MERLLSSLPWSIASFTWKSFFSLLGWSVTFVVVLFAAFTSYWVFYAVYLPTPYHLKTVHLKFSAHGYNLPKDSYRRELRSSCSDKEFPGAIVDLRSEEQNTSGDRILMRGQRYRISLELEVPNSKVNAAIGMFMTELSFQTKDEKTVASSSRPALIPYSSRLIAMLKSLFDFFLLHYGWKRESETLNLIFFENFVDDSYNPAEKATIIVYCRELQVYSAKLHIKANLSGIRYYMSYWPLMSATFGILMNISVCTLVAVWIYFKCCKQTDSSEDDLEESFQLNDGDLVERLVTNQRTRRANLSQLDNNETRQQAHFPRTRSLGQRLQRFRHHPVRRLCGPTSIGVRRRNFNADPTVLSSRSVQDQGCQTNVSDDAIESLESIDSRFDAEHEDWLSGQTEAKDD